MGKEERKSGKTGSFFGLDEEKKGVEESWKRVPESVGDELRLLVVGCELWVVGCWLLVLKVSS